jgi:hypothetical protein
MKTGKAVKVNLPNSKYHEKRGFVVSCNAHESVVDFKDGTVKKIRNRHLVEIAPYTDMSIQNKVAISIKSDLEIQVEFIKRQIAEAEKYQTQFSDGFIFAMNIMLGNINDLLNGKSLTLNNDN